MKLKAIKNIGDRISKKYGMIDKEGKPFVIAERRKLNGLRCVEVRTELTSFEGGLEFIDEVYKKLGYGAEYLGGCVYRFFKD